MLVTALIEKKESKYAVGFSYSILTCVMRSYDHKPH